MLRKIIESGIDYGLHTSAQVYLSRNQEVLLDKAFPSSGSLKKMDSMLWMSAGKPVTAVGILHGVESGRLELDDPVAKWIPDFGAGGKEEITIRHLLTHTGGFRGADVKFVHPLPFEEAVELVCKTPLEPRWVPGEKAGYHMNSSWLVLGAVLERAMQMPFEAFITKHVFEPAEMLGSGYVNRHPAPVWDTSVNPAVRHPRYADGDFYAHLRPGSNLSGPASDLGRFYECLLFRPEKFGISTALRDQMISRQRRGLKDATFRAVMDWGWGVILNNWEHGGASIPYGFGPHASSTCFGHGGSQCALGFADPEYGVAGAVIFDGMPGERTHQERMNQCMKAVYEEVIL